MNNDLKSNCYIILPNFEIRHYTLIITYFLIPCSGPDSYRDFRNYLVIAFSFFNSDNTWNAAGVRY